MSDQHVTDMALIENVALGRMGAHLDGEPLEAEQLTALPPADFERVRFHLTAAGEAHVRGMLEAGES